MFWAIKNYRGGKYRVGYWTMTSHAAFGRMMKALPNGRKEEENFASGITPVSKVTPNLPSVLHSVAQLPTECISNGMALNLKFPKGDESTDTILQRLYGYVSGYFQNGGMEIQFNIIDGKDLLDAFKHPDKEEHQKLLVRVSGYTAYFKDLNQRMQKEIIDRTEYSLTNGRMIPSDPIPLPKRSR